MKRDIDTGEKKKGVALAQQEVWWKGKTSSFNFVKTMGCRKKMPIIEMRVIGLVCLWSWADPTTRRRKAGAMGVLQLPPHGEGRKHDEFVEPERSSTRIGEQSQ